MMLAKRQKVTGAGYALHAHRRQLQFFACQGAGQRIWSDLLITGRITSRNAVCSYTSGLLLLVSTWAAAEPEDFLNLSLKDLANVSVTVASNFPGTRLDAGSTVAVIEADDWRHAGARSVGEALSYQADLLAIQPIIFGDGIAIRGYTQALSGRGTATQLDGVPINGYGFGRSVLGLTNLGLGVLDRIEVIRGPASALYGSDAIHGVVAYHAFESRDDKTEVDAGIGSTAYYQTALRQSGALSDSVRANLALTASGQGDQSQRYEFTDAVGATEHGERALRYDAQSGSVKLLSDPAQSTYWHAGLYWDRSRAGQFYGAGRTGVTTSVLGANDLADIDTDFAMTTLGLSHALAADITASVSGFIWQAERDIQLQFPIGNAFTDQTAEQKEQRSGLTLTLQQRDNPWHTSWAWALGHDDARITDAHARVLNSSGTLLSDADEPVDGMRRGVDYVELEARTRLFGEHLHVLYGGRVDRYPTFGEHHSPRLGLILFPQADFAVKLLYSNAFRAPVATELAGNSRIAGNADLKPETIDSYEFVLQKQQEHWSTELTFFRSYWNDGISIANRQFINVGDSNARGVSFSWQTAVRPWLTEFNLSWTQSEDETNHVNYGAFPKLIANLQLGYALDSGLLFYINNRAHYDTDEGPTTPTQPSPSRLPHYWRTDLHVEKAASPQLLLWADVRNVFDRNNALPSTVGSEGGVPDESINLNIGGRYRF